MLGAPDLSGDQESNVSQITKQLERKTTDEAPQSGKSLELACHVVLDGKDSLPAYSDGLAMRSSRNSA